MPSPDFGLESMIRLQPLENSEEALILLTHFVLTRKGLLFAGRGNQWEDELSLSESLPENWTDSQDVYRYVSDGARDKKYIVKFVRHDRFLLVSMVAERSESAISMNINMEREVNSSELPSQNARKIFIDVIPLINKIENELIASCEANTRSVSTETEAQDRHPPRYPGYDQQPWAPQGIQDPLRIPSRNPVPLGRRDLDPFAGPGYGGGMILEPNRFDPSQPGLGPIGPDGIRLPRGAAPPGSRFDPFGPPMSGHFPGEPDNDIFAPPGYYRGPPGGGGFL